MSTVYSTDCTYRAAALAIHLGKRGPDRYDLVSTIKGPRVHMVFKDVDEGLIEQLEAHQLEVEPVGFAAYHVPIKKECLRRRKNNTEHEEN